MSVGEKITTLRSRVKHAATWEDVNSIIELINDIEEDVEGLSQDVEEDLARYAEREKHFLARINAMEDAARDHCSCNGPVPVPMPSPDTMPRPAYATEIDHAREEGARNALDAAGYVVYPDGKALKTDHRHELTSLNLHSILG